MLGKQKEGVDIFSEEGQKELGKRVKNVMGTNEKVHLILVGYGKWGERLAKKMFALQRPLPSWENWPMDLEPEDIKKTLEAHEILVDKAKVRFHAIVEPDKNKRDKARKLGVKTLKDLDELENEVKKLDGQVVIWLATPTTKHYRTLRDTLYALKDRVKEKITIIEPKKIEEKRGKRKKTDEVIVEEPVALTEKELSKVKKITRQLGENWIPVITEIENPVIRTVIDHIKEKGMKVKGGEMEFYRISPSGLEKLIGVEEMSRGNEGGADFNHMICDASLASYLGEELGEGLKGYKVKKAKVHHYMPADLEGTALLDRWMRRTKKVNKKTAIADGELEAEIKTKNGKFKVKFRSSWIGADNDVQKLASQVKELTGKMPLLAKETSKGGTKYIKHEMRLFKMKLNTDKGKVEFIGSMLPRNGYLFLFKKDGDKWNRVPIKKYPADQVTRILVNAINSSLGLEEPKIKGKYAIEGVKALLKGRKLGEKRRVLVSARAFIRTLPHSIKLVKALRERLKYGKAETLAKKTANHVKKNFLIARRKVK